MAWRFHGRASVDPTSPRAFGVCDDCGFLFNLETLRWQLQYNATGLYNTRFLVCDRCYDIPQPQLLNPILSPDPVPVQNARVENYFLDEVDLLSTEDETPITTEDGVEIVVNQPSQNFSDPPPDPTP